MNIIKHCLIKFQHYQKNWTLKDFIEDETEYLETTEGDTVECISIENLEAIFETLNINYES